MLGFSGESGHAWSGTFIA